MDNIALLIITLWNKFITFTLYLWISIDIILNTKRIKFGFTYYLEKKSPSNEIMNELLLKGDNLADNACKDILKYLTKIKYKNKNPVDIRKWKRK